MWPEYLAHSSPCLYIKNLWLTKSDEFPLKPMIKAENVLASVEWSWVCVSGQQTFHFYRLAWLSFLTLWQKQPFTLFLRCWCLLALCKWMNELETGTLIGKMWLSCCSVVSHDYKLFLSCRMYINRLCPTDKMLMFAWVAKASFLVCTSEKLCCIGKRCTTGSWYYVISLRTFMLYHAAKVTAVAVFAF